MSSSPITTRADFYGSLRDLRVFEPVSRELVSHSCLIYHHHLCVSVSIYVYDFVQARRHGAGGDAMVVLVAGVVFT